VAQECLCQKIYGVYTDDDKKIGSDLQIDIPSPNSLAQSRCRFGRCPHCGSETAGLENKIRLSPN